jgi:hypothetical protein
MFKINDYRNEKMATFFENDPSMTYLVWLEIMPIGFFINAKDETIQQFDNS